MAGIAVIMWFGWRELAPHGWQAGLLGAAMAMGISGKCSAIALLFLLERQWRGMIAGGAVLAALSAGAFW